MERTSKITYRKLTEADLPTFIQMRITQLREGMLRTVTPSLINLTPSKMHLT